MSVNNLTELFEEKDELDDSLYDAINNMTPEKRAYLLEWMKKEFPEYSD